MKIRSTTRIVVFLAAVSLSLAGCTHATRSNPDTYDPDATTSDNRMPVAMPLGASGGGSGPVGSQQHR